MPAAMEIARALACQTKSAFEFREMTGANATPYHCRTDLENASLLIEGLVKDKLNE